MNNKFLTKEGLKYYNDIFQIQHLPFKSSILQASWKEDGTFDESTAEYGGTTLGYNAQTKNKNSILATGSLVIGEQNTNTGKNSLILGKGNKNSEDDALLIGSYVASTINGEHRLFGIGVGTSSKRQSFVEAGYQEDNTTNKNYFNGKHNYFYLAGDAFRQSTQENPDSLATLTLKEFFENSRPVLQFSNLTGFGSGNRDIKGSWRIWHQANFGGDDYYCNLVPSLDSKLNLGADGYKIKNIYAEYLSGRAQVYGLGLARGSRSPFKESTSGSINLLEYTQIHTQEDGYWLAICSLEGAPEGGTEVRHASTVIIPYFTEWSHKFNAGESFQPRKIYLEPTVYEDFYTFYIEISSNGYWFHWQRNYADIDSLRIEDIIWCPFHTSGHAED